MRSSRSQSLLSNRYAEPGLESPGSRGFGPEDWLSGYRIWQAEVLRSEDWIAAFKRLGAYHLRFSLRFRYGI